MIGANMIAMNVMNIASNKRYASIKGPGLTPFAYCIDRVLFAFSMAGYRTNTGGNTDSTSVKKIEYIRATVTSFWEG